MLASHPILLVEDDPVDAATVERAFKELKIQTPLVQAADGQEALDYLRNHTEDDPGLILLDLKMPKMNGIELLQTIKDDEALKKIPVVVLTASNEERDIVESFELGVAGYVTKPIDYDKFREVIEIVESYWTLSKRPNA
jgi:CheY-like chemotaxis protein